MKRLLKLGIVVGFAMTFVFMGCNHDVVTSEPTQGTTTTTQTTEPETEIEGIYDSEVFIYGRNITIRSTLWACDHEVTQSEYQSVMGTNPSESSYSGEGYENYPVNNVNWYDCLVYCNKRSMNEGLTPCYTLKGSTDPTVWGNIPTEENYDSSWEAVTCNFDANGYRLPTEAEWEYLARGGNLSNSGQTLYSGSNTIEDVAWWSGNSDPRYRPSEVKTKAPNALGLYDMSGNVEEWCWDRYGIILTDTPFDGVRTGPYRVTRGGSVWYAVGSCPVSERNNYSAPYFENPALGFRVVRSSR